MNWNEIYFVGDLISPNIYRYATATELGISQAVYDSHIGPNRPLATLEMIYKEAITIYLCEQKELS